ncbi:divergent protein kinase domain 2A [Panulirus ornatus]|uniref:divergent protein kinase domain 2A n=1 Tax=Panulirus ornatus TaxID=150431 RepID=UPI003A83AF66
MRRKRRRVWILCSLLLVLLIYVHGWYQTLDEKFLELHTCPACYGQALCASLIENEHSSPSQNEIVLTGFSSWKIMKFFNVKNVFYGQSGENSVVLKKLAHDSELYEFDQKLCKSVKETENCDPSQAVKLFVNKVSSSISQVISRYPHLFETTDGIKCNHNRSIESLYEQYIRIDSGPYNRHHFLTLLAVNMEPLILNAYQHHWFPSLRGMCGRMIVEDYVGPTLTQMSKVPWIIRADYARQLLELAQDLSDGEFRLYMTDVSLDNFAVDSNGKVKMIDAENIVVVDPSFHGLDTTEHINDGFGCRDCLSFSFEDLCGHTSSDHNFFAICKGILSSSAFSRDLPEGLLHTPPLWITEDHSSLLSLVEDCAGVTDDPTSHVLPTRRKAAAALHSQLITVIRKSNDSS